MSSPLTRDDVVRIAELARLALTTDEVTLFTKQLGSILEYVEQIRGLDTAGVPPTSNVMHRPLERDDEPRPGIARHEAVAAAPEPAIEAGLFKVPRVIG
jgi:aspartyl-tRNA(Asn)/glutamyl-tRNA(Gln) amidotransferase subunit C